jgi:hypothetical protein
VDLQVADSFGFIDRQMRKDESPIIVYLRNGARIKSIGKEFTEIEKDPSSILLKKKVQRI